MRSPAVAFAVSALGIALFSCMDAVMKGQSIAIGAYNAMLWRSVAGVGLSGLMFAGARGRWPDAGGLWLHARRGVAVGLSVLLFFWGLARVPMAEGVALAFLAPVFAILLAAPMLGETIRARALVACAAAFAGMGVIVGAKAEAGAAPEALRGALAIVVASMFYGYSLVLLRRAAQRTGPIEITFFTNLVLLGLYALAAPVLAMVPEPESLTWLTLAAVLAIGSSLLIAWAYAYADTQTLAPVEFTGIIWAAILGALVFGERLGWPTICGAALIVAGALAAGGRPRATAPGTEAGA